jgi:hypothetical protein
MGMSDLQVIPEHLIEADFQGRDPSALALALLKRGDILPPAVPQHPELIEIMVIAGADDLALAQGSREPVSERRTELAAQVCQQVKLVTGFYQRGASVARRKR